MTPAQLSAASFQQYPAEAQRFAQEHLPLLRELPLAIAPAFLREIIVLDYRFPAERRTFERQCRWLESLQADERSRLLAPFRQILLPTELADKDWIGAPQPFMEQLTAYLWSSSQIDAYRQAAQKLLAAPADASIAEQHRTVAVIVGKDAAAPHPQLFRKLSPLGVTLTNLRWTPQAPAQIHAMLQGGDAAEPAPYARWYIDGGEPWGQAAGANLLSYAQLRPVREAILARMNHFTQTAPGGPEELRHMLAELKPVQTGATAVSADPRMQHFITALFTEGSGSQVYSTSFVQWAAREVVRRAQPQQLLVRFAPRQRQRTLNQLFDPATGTEAPDAEGSLVDADIGAYYIWLDLMRLTDPAHATFLAWRESHGHAVLITPRAPAGKRDDSALDLPAALARYA